MAHGSEDMFGLQSINMIYLLSIVLVIIVGSFVCFKIISAQYCSVVALLL